MSKRTLSHIKLGIFVTAGLLFLILLLYMIGKNKNLFGPSFEIKAHFHSVQGLRAGNNVRYSGIQAGTVKQVAILNDTLIEVTMLIDKKMKNYIRKDAYVSITTDGLMGNKLVNITPTGNTEVGFVESGDVLPTRKAADTGEMLQTLAKTNEDVAVIAADLKETVKRINNSTATWKILNDNTLPDNLRTTLANAKTATEKFKEAATDFRLLMDDIKAGKGSLGAVMTDTSFAVNLNDAILKIKSVGDEADTLAATISRAVKDLEYQLQYGKGTATALLKDSVLAANLDKSIRNIETGTEKFNEVMEALKHNFLLRGYFRRLEKQKQKETGKPPLSN
jgi:phospholipid/cholesterol/gamma-HCH transport system substrate-binding protein